MIRGLFGLAFEPACRAAVIAAALAFGCLSGAPAQETLMLLPTPASAQGVSPAPPAAGLDALKAALDAIENSFNDGVQSEDALLGLKRRLTPMRDQLSDRIAELEPRLRQIDQRVAQLGLQSDVSAAEDAATSAERVRLMAQRGEVEGALRQAKLLSDHAFDLDERIRQRRREVFNSRLFARSAGFFDPVFWNDLAESAPAELNSLMGVLSAWSTYAHSNGGFSGAVATVALLAAMGVARWFLARWRRRLTAGPTPRRFDRALAATVNLASGTVTMPALIAATVLIPRNFRLISEPVIEIGFGLAVAAVVAGFGRGVAIGLFAPGESYRRIVALADHEAASYASHLVWASRFFGLSVFANEVHRILGASVALFIATGELLAVAILAITGHLLWRSAQAKFRSVQNDAAGTRLTWLRGILWLLGLAIATGLATGYVGFAVFVAGRMLAVLALGGAVTIMVATIDALLTDLLAADTPGGRRMAAAFGLTPRGLDLVATLLSATLRLVVIGLAVLLALNSSGIFADDIFSVLQRAASDYVVGQVRVSPIAILSALACVVIGGLAVRAAQRWLAIKFLPRTGLEAGLQNSIVALSGYVALIAVVAISLGVLGIDLQKIALIAGALSVGIGFGLQAVVSNFVAGLILLAERSIRVGDWVIVKNEEGFVRRISIRATEIETFDRASVIIPNQEFITGVVKNWTHGNTVGRIIVKVRVTYDSNVAEVRELLLRCAARHPQVLQATPPAVYLMGFGDIGIDFELRCLIGNIQQFWSVRGDLYMEILSKFRDAGIKIPAPIHEASVPAFVPSSPAAPKGA
jgi:potassium-dependent mechanosensitive channel